MWVGQKTVLPVGIGEHNDADFRLSQRGAVVVGILADANAFISYDMRENNIVADAADS